MKSSSYIPFKMPPLCHALPNTPIYNMIRFWGRKPHNIVRDYIETYTEKGDVVLDPFAGSGVVAIEALKSMRKVIYNDLNLYCRFIAKTSSTPVNINKLEKSFHKLIKNLETKNYTVKINKKKKNISFDWMYSTLCPFCSKPSETISVTFTKMYKINDDPKIKFLSIKHKGEIIRVPRDLIRDTGVLTRIAFEIYKVIQEHSEISHKELSSKLKLDVRAEEITRSINEVLTGRGFIKAIKEIPIEIEYECKNDSCSKRRGRKNPENGDLDKIKKINKMEPAYGFPALKLAYPSSDRFATYRPGTESIDVLFTKRNLIALSILKHEIENLDSNREIKDAFLLAFSAILEHVCNMQRPNKKGWAVKNYIIHPIFLEMNVLHAFKRRVGLILAGKKEANEEVSKFYVESRDPNKITKNSANVCFLNLDARKLPLDDNSVDYVFTDPEYGGSIQYYELSLLASSWLGFKNDWKNEIVVNTRQDKSPELYRDMLCEAFKEIYRVLQPNKYMSVTFHSREIRYWNALMYAIQVAGFKYVTAIYQIPQKEYTNWIYARNPGEMSGDVYITFYKSKYKPPKEYEEVDMAHIIQNIINPEAREMILLHNGQATFNQLVRGITLRLISAGLMHNPKIRDIDYEKIFNENFNRLGKGKIWRLKEKEKVSPVDFIPLDRRIEWIMFSVFNRTLKTRKRVTASDVLSAIFTTLKNSKTPENKEILEILREEAEPRQEEGIPYWIPKSMKQMKLFFEAEKIPLGIIRRRENLDHDRIIRAMADLGNIFGLDVWIGEPEVKKNSELKKHKTIEKLEIPFVSPVLLKRLKNVDVIFLRKGQSPKCLIEVEHTSDIRSGLLRMANIFEEAEHLKIETFTILPDKRVDKLKEILTEPSIKKLIGERQIYYATYSLIAKFVDELEYRKLAFPDFINICEVLELN